MRSQRDLARSAVDGLSDEDAYVVYQAVEAEYIDISVGVDRNDRLPDGASSPSGPDEGRSSFFADLRDELDLLSNEAAQHPWFAENPHWNYELHDHDKARVYLSLR